MAPLPHNSKQQQSTIVSYQPSEQQSHIQNGDTHIAQSQSSSMCNYVRQAFKKSGIPITHESTIVKLVSGKPIIVPNANRLYDRLMNKSTEYSRVDNNPKIPNGTFWIDLNDRRALAQPAIQNVSLKSNEKLFAQRRNNFAIFLKAKGHICKFWIGLNGIKRGDYGSAVLSMVIK